MAAQDQTSAPIVLSFEKPGYIPLRRPHPDYLDLAVYYWPTDSDSLWILNRGLGSLSGNCKCIDAKKDCPGGATAEAVYGAKAEPKLGEAQGRLQSHVEIGDVSEANLPRIPLLVGRLREKIIEVKKREKEGEIMHIRDSVEIVILWEEARLQYMSDGKSLDWECPCVGGKARALYSLGFHLWFQCFWVTKEYETILGQSPSDKRVPNLNRAIKLLEEAIEVGKEEQISPLELSRYLVHLGMLSRSRYKLHTSVYQADQQTAKKLFGDALKILENSDSGDDGRKGRMYKALHMLSAIWHEDFQTYKDATEGMTRSYEAARRLWNDIQDEGPKPIPVSLVPGNDSWMHGYRYAQTILLKASQLKQPDSVDWLIFAIDHTWGLLESLPQAMWANYRELLTITLAKMLLDRFRQSSDGQDVYWAMIILKAALEKNLGLDTGEITLPVRRAVLQGMLAEVYEANYHQTGDIHILEEGIRLFEAAISNHNNVRWFEVPPVRQYQRMLGVLLQNRYSKVKGLEDLNRAIQISEAVGFEADTLWEAIGSLENMAVLYMHRCQRLLAQSDFERAISLAQKALDICRKIQTDHDSAKVDERKAGVLDLMSHLLGLRAHLTESPDVKDLEQAHALAIELVRLTPEVHVDRPERLARLSESFFARAMSKSQVNGEEAVSNLQQGIGVAEEALRLCPNTSYIYADLALNCGQFYTYAVVFLHATNIGEQSPQMIEIGVKVLHYYLEAFRSTSSPFGKRIRAGARIMRSFIHREMQLWEMKDRELEIYEVLSEAVKLLPMASAQDLQLEDHEVRLWEYSWELPLVTASLALKIGKPAAEALCILELGRGVIQGKWIDYRTDLTMLRKAYPELADRFDTLRKKMDTNYTILHGNEVYKGPEFPPIRNKEQHTMGGQRMHVGREIEQVLAEIRQLPGFENFLLPLQEEQFCQAASDGPIIIINVTSAWGIGEALIVRTTGVTSLCLDSLNAPDAEKMMNGLGKSEGLEGRNQNMRTMLGWLWDTTVKPVLNELGYLISRGAEKLPHVWWIGVGEMSRAPFHAAGRYPRAPRKAEYTAKYCISSYTPTIKALLYAREKDKKQDVDEQPMKSVHSEKNLLAVMMPTTPGEEDLVGVQAEIAAITAAATGLTSIKVLESPTADTTLENIRLGVHNIIHFACHGMADSQTPSSSRLLLQKENRETGGLEVDILTVKAIAAVRLVDRAAGATLAYLSACSSAGQKRHGLMDEGLHIASAFQVAGFSHVIGTLWESEDDVCTEVASEFYRLLLGGKGPQGEVFGIENCAEALHLAVEKVRSDKNYWHKPASWAPFSHWGA